MSWEGPDERARVPNHPYTGPSVVPLSDKEQMERKHHRENEIVRAGFKTTVRTEDLEEQGRGEGRSKRRGVGQGGSSKKPRKSGGPPTGPEDERAAVEAAMADGKGVVEGGNGEGKGRGQGHRKSKTKDAYDVCERMYKLQREQYQAQNKAAEAAAAERREKYRNDHEQQDRFLALMARDTAAKEKEAEAHLKEAEAHLMHEENEKLRLEVALLKEKGTQKGGGLGFEF